MTSTPDARIRVFVNTNLTWSRGKMAAHVAHAVLQAAGVHPEVPIVVLGGKPRDIREMATFIEDEGRTELEPGTLTAGTDYVFASAAARDEAVRELSVLAETCTPDVAEKLTGIVALLRTR